MWSAGRGRRQADVAAGRTHSTGVHMECCAVRAVRRQLSRASCDPCTVLRPRGSRDSRVVGTARDIPFTVMWTTWPDGWQTAAPGSIVISLHHSTRAPLDRPTAWDIAKKSPACGRLQLPNADCRKKPLRHFARRCRTLAACDKLHWIHDSVFQEREGHEIARDWPPQVDLVWISTLQSSCTICHGAHLLAHIVCSCSHLAH